MKLLVLDAYAPAGRDALVRAGATPAGELYRAQLQRIATTLPACGPARIEIDIAFPAHAAPQPPGGADLAEFDGAVWTGSSLSILDADTPEVSRQIGFAAQLAAAGVPSFGSCWAAQLAAVVAGGSCAANPRGREFGIARRITLDPAGLSHPLYAGKPAVFDGFTSHADEVRVLPAGATRLASNAFSDVQALALEHAGVAFWAVQYHPEYTPREVAALCRLRCDELVAQRRFPDRKTAQRFAEGLDALQDDPTLRDVAAELGIGPDLLDERIRTREIRNWIESVAIPRRDARSSGADR